jgi:hypothetical protein
VHAGEFADPAVLKKALRELGLSPIGVTARFVW